MKLSKFLVFVQLVAATKFSKRFLPITANLPDFGSAANLGIISNINYIMGIIDCFISKWSFEPKLSWSLMTTN